AVLRHEALYAAFILTEIIEPENKKDAIKINSLEELPESFDWYDNHLTHPVEISEKFYTYGVCLFNKWCGFSQIQVDKPVAKRESNTVSRAIFRYCNKDSGKFYSQLKILCNKLFFFITTTSHCPSINVNEMADLVDEPTRDLFKKLPKDNVELGYHINQGLIKRCVGKFNKNHQLYKLFKSGSRFSETQLARSCINIGYSADAQNVVIPQPIRGNLLTGLSQEDFFLGSPGTRKSIRDKSKWTPDSGYLERTLVMALSVLEIMEHDCGGSNFLEFVVFSDKHAETLVGKYYKDPQEPWSDWDILDFHTAKDFINKKIYIRSPMTCTTPNNKMCRICFGERQFSTKYLGIVCGQTISERLTQLVLRTFHTSGSAELTLITSVVAFIRDHLIDIINEEDKITLVFDTISVHQSITKLEGYLRQQLDQSKAYVVFSSFKDPVINNDTISMLKQIQNLLKTQKSPKLPPVEYYLELMTLVLQVGTPYSSFVEMVFANMFMTNKKEKEFWRYHPDERIQVKLGDKTLSGQLSPLLGLLYQPNRNTIAEMDKLEELDLDNIDLTIYEKIFLSRL
ncbi:MAG: hypothetical protein R3250_06020, partial [Melioribacteraceae bacterium]|nr:hypothetical protein [Melioribacteraceae bacterium]